MLFLVDEWKKGGKTECAVRYILVLSFCSCRLRQNRYSDLDGIVSKRVSRSLTALSHLLSPTLFYGNIWTGLSALKCHPISHCVPLHQNDIMISMKFIAWTWIFMFLWWPSLERTRQHVHCPSWGGSMAAPGAKDAMPMSSMICVLINLILSKTKKSLWLTTSWLNMPSTSSFFLSLSHSPLDGVNFVHRSIQSNKPIILCHN